MSLVRIICIKLDFQLLAYIGINVNKHGRLELKLPSRKANWSGFERINDIKNTHAASLCNRVLVGMKHIFAGIAKAEL